MTASKRRQSRCAHFVARIALTYKAVFHKLKIEFDSYY
jgi:hypothetical protein